MFRKLISDVTFSSSLIGELGRYAQRLKQEELLRRLSVWFTLASAIITTVVFLSPPTSSNTAHPNDLIRGGIASQQELLERYGNNDSDIKSIFTALGISHGDILKSKEKTIALSDARYLSGRITGEHSQVGEYSYNYTKKNGTTGTIYLAPTSSLRLSGNETLRALTGTSETLGSFAILLSSGNVALSEPPRSTTAATSAPCDTENQQDPCRTPMVYTKTAQNVTQRVDATTTPAQPRDRIVYTITATNQSSIPTATIMSDAIADIREYAEVVNTDGGIFDEETKVISWTTPLLAPGESYSRTLTIRLKPDLAATAQGTSNPSSYDCTLVNTLGNTTAIPVACPPVKYVETLSHALPVMPSVASFYGSITLFFTALLLYLRAKTYREEVRLIRKDINSGALL